MDGPQETKAFARKLRRELTLPEVVIWQAVRGQRLEGFRFRRQHPIGPYVLDFYCDAAKLAVEIDGDWHGMGDQPERDSARDAWFAARGIETLRISARELLEEADGAIVALLDALRRRSDPRARRAAERGGQTAGGRGRTEPPPPLCGPPPPAGEDWLDRVPVGGRIAKAGRACIRRTRL
jgi:very-short-patch-repair endonuclease